MVNLEKVKVQMKREVERKKKSSIIFLYLGIMKFQNIYPRLWLFDSKFPYFIDTPNDNF